MKRFLFCAAILAAASLSANADTATHGGGRGGIVTINELMIDQSGTDNDEFFELAGSPGASLAGLTYIVLGDGTGGSGVVETVVPLVGAIPADGYFLAVESTFTLGIGNADLVVPGANDLNFENSDTVTHMLVAGWTGASAQDLDTNDDGILDVTPWAALLDSIALQDDVLPPTAGAEWGYGAASVGPEGTFPPGNAYRLPNGSGPWSYFAFADGPAFVTPGAANVPEPTTIALLSLGGLALIRRR